MRSGIEATVSCLSNGATVSRNRLSTAAGDGFQPLRFDEIDSGRPAHFTIGCVGYDTSQGLDRAAIPELRQRADASDSESQPVESGDRR